MRPIKQREVGQWIEVEFELPREKARKAAQEYYARYPREGYDTHWLELGLTLLTKSILILLSNAEAMRLSIERECPS